MRNVLKFAIILPVIIVFFGLIGSWFVFEYKKDWLKDELLLVANDNFKGEFQIESLGYDLFTYFPKVAITLNNVSFIEDGFVKPNENIFSLKKIALDFDLKELLSSSKLIIKRAVIEDGSLNLIEYEKYWNIANAFSVLNEISSDQSNTSLSSPFVLAIEELEVKQASMSILLDGNKNAEFFKFENVKAKLKLSGNVLDIEVNSNQEIRPTFFEKYDLRKLEKSELSSGFSIDLNTDKIDVRSSVLRFLNQSYQFKGSYSYQKDHIIDLEFKGFINDSEMHEAFTKGKVYTRFSQNEKVLNFKVSSFNVDVNKALNEYNPHKFAEGNVDFCVDWKFKGYNFSEFKKNSNAKIGVNGKDIMLYGMDLDHLLKNYKKSQNFNLVDIGAFAFAGPFGTVAVKGSDFTKLLTTKFTDKDSSNIKELVIDMNLSKGVLKAEDVAFSTNNNRLALFADYDIVKDSIPNAEIVVLTDRACQILGQKFHGNPEAIVLDEVKVVKTLMGSVVNLFRTLTLQKCNPIYFGKVSHPVPTDPNYFMIDGANAKKIFEKKK